MVQGQKRPGTMALGVESALIQLADRNWCFEIHHTFSVVVLPAREFLLGGAAGYVGKVLIWKFTLF